MLRLTTENVATFQFPQTQVWQGPNTICKAGATGTRRADSGKINSSSAQSAYGSSSSGMWCSTMAST